MGFGKKLREIRHMTGKSLRDVEIETNINRGYLSRLEREEIPNAPFSRLEELAEYYGVDVATIVKDDEDWKMKLDPKLKKFVEENNIGYLKIGIKAKEKNLSPEDVEKIIEIMSKKVNTPD
jgi:transcriptional regulator with XRE-family HTH domain